MDDNGTAGVIAPPPLIFGAALAFGLLLQKLRPVKTMPGPVARLVGLPLVVGGIALGVWGFRVMKEAGTSVDPTEPVRHLVTTGPFAYSRNPLYASLTMIYLGIAALRNAFWPLLLLPFALRVIRSGVIAREEGYLARRFGDKYRQYRERVPRWL